MIRAFIIRIGAISLIVLSPLILWFGWHEKTKQTTFDIKGAFDEKVIVSSQLNDVNLFNSESEWTDQNGQTHLLNGFKGQPALVGFIYTNCLFTCSSQTLKMRAIEMRLSTEVSDHLQFVTFSIDPESDTPSELKKYADKFNIESPQWYFLRGGLSDVKSLTRSLSFFFKKEGQTVVHADMLAVIDQEGHLVKQFWGDWTSNDVVEFINQSGKKGEL